jgi:tetratricopeptide (TPR) repeat protein
MVADARSAGARPVFLLFPRPSQVSTQFKWEDSALAVREEALPPRDGRGLDEKGLKALRARDLRLLENSCLDHRRYEDPIGVMREQIASWQPVRPNDGEVLALLAEGSHNFAAAHYAEAAARFAAALERQPDSPLALYDWGVSLIMAGDRDTGLDSLDRADRLSCNAFLHYNVLTWKIATELNVPVVDLTLFFQTRGNQSLFLDPVHPNVAGHHLIAVALWQTLNRLSPTSPATTKSKG